MAAKSCDNCFYEGCGLKQNLVTVAKHGSVDTDHAKVGFFQVMGENCNVYRRKCSKCGERIPNENE